MRNQFVILALLSTALFSTYLIPARASALSWSVSLDANSTSQIDTQIQTSATNQKSFRVGAILDATSANPVVGVYGWQFTINYNSSMFTPQGDPNPLATEGNPLGLYPDGATNTVLWGSQTTSGSVNWAGLITANRAFGSFRANVTSGKTTVFFTMLSTNPSVNLAASTLLANVNFEILKKTNVPESFTVSNVTFVNSSDSPISGIAAGNGATEMVTNDPPHASFISNLSRKVGPFAYTFNGKASSDTDDKISDPAGYFWDFGDGTQDLGLSGSIVTHNYTTIAPFNVTLRVQDPLGATGASRDSLANVIVNLQPSHTYVDPSGGPPNGSPQSISTDGCVSMPQAFASVTSASRFVQLNSARSYTYDGYGTSTDGMICRAVVFFKSQSGDRIEGMVNPDGSLDNLVPVSSVSSVAASSRPQLSSATINPNWSGYEIDCAHSGLLGPVGCNPDGTNRITGASMSFTLPTASSPTGVGINGGSCCEVAEWVGVGEAKGATPGPLIQAGIWQGTNTFADNNYAAVYEINYDSANGSGNATLDANNHIAWPCPGTPTAGDTITITVNETTISYATNQTSIDFQWIDSNNGSLNCMFDYGRLVSGEYPVSWAYYIVEAPNITDKCVLQASTICELPAWPDRINENAYLETWSSHGLLPIDKVAGTTTYEDVLSQCIGYNSADNVVPSALNGNSWFSAWLTSAQIGPRPPECDQRFTLAPYPNYLLLSGSFKPSFVTVNSVNGYSSPNLVFTIFVSPSSGLTVSCPNYNVDSTVNPSYAQCNFTASTPGIYNVIINGTTTLPQGFPLTYSTNMTVIVASIPASYTSTYGVGGVSVNLEGGFYSNNGVLIGSTTLTATNSSGTVIFSKTRSITPSNLKFVEEVSTRPYWLSVNCLIGSFGVTCSLTRTLDIRHNGATLNIIDLAIVAGCFGQSAQCGAFALQYPGLCPQCSTSADLTGPGGPPDGCVNIFDMTAEALFFFAPVIPP